DDFRRSAQPAEEILHLADRPRPNLDARTSLAGPLELSPDLLSCRLQLGTRFGPPHHVDSLDRDRERLAGSGIAALHAAHHDRPRALGDDLQPDRTGTGTTAGGSR